VRMELKGAIDTPLRLSLRLRRAIVVGSLLSRPMALSAKLTISFMVTYQFIDWKGLGLVESVVANSHILSSYFRIVFR